MQVLMVGVDEAHAWRIELGICAQIQGLKVAVKSSSIALSKLK